MVKSRLSAEDAQMYGWLLDGYPRSAEQAEAIEAVDIRPDIFILINVRVAHSTSAGGAVPPIVITACTSLLCWQNPAWVESVCSAPVRSSAGLANVA